VLVRLVSRLSPRNFSSAKLNRFLVARRLVNTGWTGGPPGVGSRCPIRITRSIIDAIHDGSLAQASYSPSPVFNLAVPDEIPGRDVPPDLLDPRKVWSDEEAFEGQLRKLAVS